MELTSCIIEVLQGFNSGILIQLGLYLHRLYLSEQVEGELLTIQCDNAGSLELARETLQQFFSKPPAPKPEVTVALSVHFLNSLVSTFSCVFTGDAEQGGDLITGSQPQFNERAQKLGKS